MLFEDTKIAGTSQNQPELKTDDHDFLLFSLKAHGQQGHTQSYRSFQKTGN